MCVTLPTDPPAPTWRLCWHRTRTFGVTGGEHSSARARPWEERTALRSCPLVADHQRGRAGTKRKIAQGMVDYLHMIRASALLVYVLGWTLSWATSAGAQPVQQIKPSAPAQRESPIGPLEQPLILVAPDLFLSTEKAVPPSDESAAEPAPAPILIYPPTLPPPREHKPRRPAWYRRWWVWTAVGGVAATTIIVGSVAGTWQRWPDGLKYYDLIPVR